MFALASIALGLTLIAESARTFDALYLALGVLACLAGGAELIRGLRRVA
jgi:uncharacterized membrane protein HdeD (DUF308 family)